MKRKLILIGSILVVISLILMDQYTMATYHMNVFEYFFGVHQLTIEDKAYLKAHGSIIYASDNNSPPLRYFDEESGQYKGIVIDYL